MTDSTDFLKHVLAQVKDTIGIIDPPKYDNKPDGSLCRYCGSWTPSGAVCGCRGER